MDGGNCVTAVAKNCETYLSKDACATCPNNQVFEDKNGVINCVLNTKTNCL